MKKTLLMSTMLAALLLGACSKNGDSGNLSFSIAGDTVVTDLTKSQVSDYTSIPDGGEFTVTVTDSGSNEVWKGKLKDMPGSKLTLRTGSYTAAASYGSAREEGEDKPYLSGSANFTVTGGESSQVTIPVSLTNCIVRIEGTDIFNKYFTSYDFTMKTVNGNTFTFAKSDTKAVFIDTSRFDLEGTLVNQTGTSFNFTKKTYENLKGATCYTVKFDAPQVGGMTVTITFNDTTETVELGTIELND